MRARWVGISENIGPKMCQKLVDNNISDEVICISTICSAIEHSTANLKVDSLEPRPAEEESNETDQYDDIFDEFMLLADFDTPCLNMIEKGPVDLIPTSTTSKTWQDIQRGEEHNKDTQ